MVEQWVRLRDFGLRLHQERQVIADDVRRLSQKFEMACDNHAKASDYLRQLRELRGDQEDWELDDLCRVHEGKRRLYLQAARRIYAILRLNELFQMMLAEMAEDIHHALHASLDLLRAQVAGQPADRFAQNEFAGACGRLQSYLKLYEQVGRGGRPNSPS